MGRGRESLCLITPPGNASLFCMSLCPRILYFGVMISAPVAARWANAFTHATVTESVRFLLTVYIGVQREKKSSLFVYLKRLNVNMSERYSPSRLLITCMHPAFHKT